jgi:hypothetical protein
VVDLIWEVFEGTEGNAFLRWVYNISVTDGSVRNDDLRVAFRTQSAAFEQRFFEPNTLTIDVLPGFNIIDSVDNEIEVSPEVIVEDYFIFLTDS